MSLLPEQDPMSERKRVINSKKPTMSIQCMCVNCSLYSEDDGKKHRCVAYNEIPQEIIDGTIKHTELLGNEDMLAYFNPLYPQY